MGHTIFAMKRSFFWLLLALIALSVVVNVAVADGGDDGSDDEADDAPPLAEGQAAEQGDAQVEEDDDEGAFLAIDFVLYMMLDVGTTMN